jgi:hypothetical protein
MSSNCETQWPAREPSGHFAERTVDAMLATSREHVAARRSPRAIRFLLLAALFASGSALALTWAHHHQHRASVPPAVVLNPVPTVLQSIRLQVSPVVPPAAPSASVVVRKSAPSATAVRSVKPAPKSPIPSTQLRRPACQCERGFSDFICDCY